MKVSASVSMGLREDGRLGESLLGMEMGGGIGFTNPYGYEISTKGGMLFAGTESVQEWGLSGKLSYDSGSYSFGMLLSIAPEWGRTMLDADNAFLGDSVCILVHFHTCSDCTFSAILEVLLQLMVG